jgi:GH24 family phage-related lysozyme (muramidase)
MKKIIAILVFLCFAKSDFPNVESHKFIQDNKLEFKPSKECIEFIKKTEGFRAYEYWDVNGWTYGFGSHSKKRRYRKIDTLGAEILMQKYLQSIRLELKEIENLSIPVSSQGQIDAIYSVCYNSGVPNFKKSRLHQLIINKADIYDILNEFTSKYEKLHKKYPKNSTYKNLYFRRIKESLLFR